MSNKYNYGFEKDMFEGMEASEIYALAAIGLNHVKELEQELLAGEKIKVSINWESKDDVELAENDRLKTLFYERRNGFRRAKETAMSLYARVNSAKFHKMMSENLKRGAERNDNKD